MSEALFIRGRLCCEGVWGEGAWKSDASGVGASRLRGRSRLSGDEVPAVELVGFASKAGECRSDMESE